MANNIMNIMSVSFNSQAELEDFLNRVKGKDDDGEKDFSLQSVVPMPESLQIVSPCDRMLAWAAVNKYGIDPEKYPENVRKAICRETFLLHREEKLTASRTRETAISLLALQWVGELKPVSSITMMASVFPRANLPKMFLNCA